MEAWGDYWPFILAAGALGAFLAPIVGYFRRPGQRNGNGRQWSSTMSGAAIVDSSLLERVAVALEGLLEIERARERQEQRRREAEHENAIRDRDALRRKLDEQDRNKR